LRDSWIQGFRVQGFRGSEIRCRAPRPVSRETEDEKLQNREPRNL